MQVRIYSPSKTAMQSGRARSSGRRWLIEPVLETVRRPEPLMGWTSADDTLVQLMGRLAFDSADQAAQFAAKKGWAVVAVDNWHERVVTPRNYLDNFKTDTPKKNA